MTLCFIVARPDHALVATDTVTTRLPDFRLWRRADGAPMEVSKIHPLAHMPAVMLATGDARVGHRLLQHCDDWHDVDGAIEYLPALLATSTSHCAVNRGAVYFVGHSPRHGGMVCAYFNTDSSWQRFSTAVYAATRGHTPVYISGPPAEWQGQHPATTEEALAHARAQVARCVADKSGDPLTGTATPYGGRLLVAELTRDAIHMSTPGDLGWPPKQCAT